MEDALKSLSGELFDDLSMKQRIFETDERSLREEEYSEPIHQSEPKLNRYYVGKEVEAVRRVPL